MEVLREDIDRIDAKSDETLTDSELKYNELKNKIRDLILEFAKLKP